MKASCPYPPSCREHPFPETRLLEPIDRTEVDSEAPDLLAKIEKPGGGFLRYPPVAGSRLFSRGRVHRCAGRVGRPQRENPSAVVPLIPMWFLSATQDSVP